MTSQCIFIGATLSDSPVSQHFRALAEALAARGHRVVLLTPHRQVEAEKPEGNPAIYTWPSERPTRLRDARFLIRLIRRYRPGCLIANFSAVNIMSVVGWWMRLPCRVAWYHTTSLQLARDYPAPRWQEALLQVRKRWVYRAATQVVANSQASLEDLERLYRVPPRKRRVFYNSLADPVAELDLARVAPIPGRLVCVGRFFPSKGQDVLLRALARLAETHRSVSLELIGDGPAREECERLARQLRVEDHCTFTGALAHPEVLRRMAGAVATVVPSRSEAFGLVNIESMAVGTPVVASAVGGIVEIVRDGLDGFLVPPEAPEALAAKLGRLLSEPALRSKMGAQARERFLSTFEQRRVVQQQADWCEEMLADKKSEIRNKCQ